MIHCKCPYCDRLLAVSDAHAGQLGRCPKCQGKFTIPAKPGVVLGPPSSTVSASSSTFEALLSELPSIGEKVDLHIGEYHLTERIGSGGMGTVYLGKHMFMGKVYAVKVLSEALSGDEAFRERFRTEARVMAELRHPQIVQVHHAGESGGKYFLAMDYVTGPDGRPESLREHLRGLPDGRLDERKICAWGREIAEGLAYAHERGVIHRDIKPGNILIGSDEHVRITDFGLARAVGNEFLLSKIHESFGKSRSREEDDIARERGALGDTLDVQRTEGLPGSAGELDREGVLGTYDYMAPEQRRELPGEIDERTDIYAFGLLLYRMLTGRRPAAMAKPPSHVVPELSPSWDGIVERCLEHLPTDRYASFREITDDLTRLTQENVAGVLSPWRDGQDRYELQGRMEPQPPEYQPPPPPPWALQWSRLQPEPPEYQPPPSWPWTPHWPPQQRQGNGFAAAGLVFGIMSLLFVYPANIGLACAIVGLAMSAKGKRTSRATGRGYGLAIAGLVLSIIGLVVDLTIVIIRYVAFNARTWAQ